MTATHGRHGFAWHFFVPNTKFHLFGQKNYKMALNMCNVFARISFFFCSFHPKQETL